MDKRDLHRLIDRLPDVKTDEAARLLVALLREAGFGAQGEDLPADDDRAWQDAGLGELAANLAAIEADVPPEDLRVWLAAFERKARPCTYVPGQGFVPHP
jgi:hypothetical protein